MADAIWNDRYILANGAVSANAPLSGDGSNSQPLGIDLHNDNSISGNGTVDSPLGVVNPLPYPVEFVGTSGEATGANILYVVTGTGE